MNISKFSGGAKAVFLCFIIAFCLCSCDFNTANISISDIRIKQTLVSNTGGYYLAEDGTLYSPGADSDAGEYVCYIDKKQGIVAKNVLQFDTVSGGGWCVTDKNELCLWHRDKIPFFGYTNNKHLQKIADNVENAILTKDSAVYTDTAGNLYISGNIDFDNPKLIASRVRWFGFIDSDIAYLDDNGKILEYDPNTDKSTVCESFKEITVDRDDTSFRVGQLPHGDLLVLKNNRLEFWGNYDKLTGKSDTNSFSKTTLAENTIDFDFSEKLIVAVDSGNRAYAWGECLMNGKDNTKTPEYEYCEKKIIRDNVKSVSVSSGTDICFVNCDGRTESFRSSDIWHFFGNSDKSEVVGINNEPVVWKK